MNAVVEAEVMQPSRIERLPAASVTPMHMLQAALDQGADLAKLEQLMGLQERWEKNEARKAYVAAMAQFKRNPPEILKRKHVHFTGNTGKTTDYHHATLADVCDAAIAALAAVGISHRWDVEQKDGGGITVHCVLTHEQGHRDNTTLSGRADDSGNKNAIQAIGSAVTYLQRYTLLAATGLATRDLPDDDGKASSKGPELVSAQQVMDLEALISEVGANYEQFLKFLRINDLRDLPAKKYQAACAALNARRR
jgi:hypothetical protein